MVRGERNVCDRRPRSCGRDIYNGRQPKTESGTTNKFKILKRRAKKRRKGRQIQRHPRRPAGRREASGRVQIELRAAQNFEGGHIEMASNL